MTNGAECIIKKIDYRVPGSLRPSIIWVLFREEHIGKDYGKEYSHLFNQSIDRHWVPILEITRQFRRHQMQVLPSTWCTFSKDSTSSRRWKNAISNGNFHLIRICSIFYQIL